MFKRSLRQAQRPVTELVEVTMSEIIYITIPNTNRLYFKTPLLDKEGCPKDGVVILAVSSNYQSFITLPFYFDI